MLSIDTNILFHAYSKDSRDHVRAYQWLLAQNLREDIGISEFILAT
jgi:predicted nucleic acid-binding protein